jgi:hypothetical protein
VVKRRDVAETLQFLETVARKMLDASRAALVQYLHDRGIEYDAERKKALEQLVWE